MMDAQNLAEQSVTQPRTFTPRPYQKLIMDHQLDTARCGIWAGMGMGKTSSTLTMINDLQLLEGNPVLVLAPLRVATSTWPDEGRKWQHLTGTSIMPITGSLEERRRALRFDAAVYTTNYEQLPWLFAHPASAGHGLNLQDGGNILAFFGMDWNLENRLQIIERIGPTRQLQAGHNRPMFIYNIIARETVDELVLQRVETKRAVQDLLLDAMKTKGVK